MKGKINLSIGMLSAAIGVGISAGGASAAQIAHFTANEGSGTVLQDTSVDPNTMVQNDHDMTLYNGVSFVPGVGGSGTAISFDGSNDLGQIGWPAYSGNNPLSNMATAGTFEFWYYRPTGAATGGAFMGFNNTTGSNYEDIDAAVYGDPYDSGNVKGVTGNNNGGADDNFAIIGGVAPIFNAWTHIVFAWDSSGESFYQNGVLINSSSVQNPIMSSNFIDGNFNVGFTYGIPGNYQGYLDEISLWDSKLDAATVLQRFQAIPEPASLGLLGMGLVALAGRSPVRR